VFLHSKEVTHTPEEGTEKSRPCNIALLALMQIRTDAICPLYYEDEETVLHVLGKCNALSAKRVNIPGCLNLGYEELCKVH